MHVKTLNWSGMRLTQYAAAAKLSKASLCRWRTLIDSGEVEIDWRARLHPSARPQISSDVSSAAYDRPAEIVVTAHVPGDPPRDRRSNRRSFTDEERLAIVTEAEQPGVGVAWVCRHHDIAISMVYRSRIQLGFEPEARARPAVAKVTDKRPGASSRRRLARPRARLEACSCELKITRNQQRI